jgi:hypothetical protein
VGPSCQILICCSLEHQRAHELTHNSSGEGGYWAREPLRKDSPQSRRKARTSTAAAPTKPLPQDILRSFNSWAFKREQPANLHVMLQCIARAVALTKSVPFILYWGQGPRSALAAADTQCLDFIKRLADRVAEVHEPGASITLILTDTHARLNGYLQGCVETYFAAMDGAARQRGFSTCRLSKVVAEHRGGTAHESRTDSRRKQFDCLVKPARLLRDEDLRDGAAAARGTRNKY